MNKMKPKSKSKERTIKAWAVVWLDEVKREYGVRKGDEIISHEIFSWQDHEPIMVPSKEGEYKLNLLAVFSKKREAVVYLKSEGGDFKVVPIKITL